MQEEKERIHHEEENLLEQHTQEQQLLSIETKIKSNDISEITQIGNV